VSDKDSLLDQWIRRLKNNPVVAVLLLFGVTIGALASFTGALGKLAELVAPSQPPVATPPPVVALFQTRPQEIQRGEKATLEWSVAQADSVTTTVELSELIQTTCCGAPLAPSQGWLERPMSRV
jgi:hypothetical protein